MRTRLFIFVGLLWLATNPHLLAAQGDMPQIPPMPTIAGVPDCHDDFQTRQSLRERRANGLACMYVFSGYMTRLSAYRNELEDYVRQLDGLWRSVQGRYRPSEQTNFYSRLRARREEAVQQGLAYPGILETYRSRANFLWTNYCALPMTRCQR